MGASLTTVAAAMSPRTPRKPVAEIPPGMNLDFFDERVREFKKMSNSDGIVTKQSFVSFLSAGKKTDCKATFEQFFDTADKDKSGSLDIHEFLFWQNIQPLDNVALRLRAVFIVFDKDDSGTLSWDEVRRMFVLTVRRRIPAGSVVELSEVGRVVDEVFAKVDTDKSGSLSMAEFVQGFSEHPEVIEFFLKCLWKTPRATPQ